MTNRSIYAKHNEAEGRGNCRQPAAADEGQAEANRRNGKTDMTGLTGERRAIAPAASSRCSFPTTSGASEFIEVTEAVMAEATARQVRQIA